jgi:hypothetical protein
LLKLRVLGQLEIYGGMLGRNAQFGMFRNVGHALTSIVDFPAISQATQELFNRSKTHEHAPRILCLRPALSMNYSEHALNSLQKIGIYSFVSGGTQDSGSMECFV